MNQSEAYIVALAATGTTTSIDLKTLNTNDSEYLYSFHTLIVLGDSDESVSFTINNEFTIKLVGGFVLNQIPLKSIVVNSGEGCLLVGQKTIKVLFN